jgi:hypothetical protein
MHIQAFNTDSQLSPPNFIFFICTVHILYIENMLGFGKND